MIRGRVWYALVSVTDHAGAYVMSILSPPLSSKNPRVAADEALLAFEKQGEAATGVSRTGSCAPAGWPKDEP